VTREPDLSPSLYPIENVRQIGHHLDVVSSAPAARGGRRLVAPLYAAVGRRGRVEQGPVDVAGERRVELAHLADVAEVELTVLQTVVVGLGAHLDRGEAEAFGVGPLPAHTLIPML